MTTTDFRPTNVKIAELLQQQTYDERMEMAAWFSDVAGDIGSEVTASDMATWLGSWANGEIEAHNEASQ